MSAGICFSLSKPMEPPTRAKGERGEIALPPLSLLKASPCMAAPTRMPASKSLGCLRVEKIIFFSQGKPFFRTKAARSASMIRSKLTLVGQLVMQDLQTRQLNSIS